MSINFGFINKKEVTAKQDTLELMRKSYQGYPTDSYNFSIYENFAVGFLSIDILTENPIEKQPIETSNLIISGRIRIDNRKELINKLSMRDKIDEHKLSDISLFLLCYEKWNDDAYNKISGDFAIIIFNKNKKEITIVKDVSGIYPLYYFETNERFYFASTVSALLELPEYQREVNYRQLIINMIHGFVTPYPEDTIYKNIQMFSVFHYYKINRNGIIDRQRYWFPENLSPIIYKNENDYIDHFYELYNDSVYQRLSKKGKNASFLSGGLDSSSITILSLKHLQKMGKNINCFSSVPQYPDKTPPSGKSISDETTFIQSILDMYPEIIHQFVKSEDLFPLDAINLDLEHNKLFTMNFQNNYWIWKIYLLAAQDGTNVLLNGQAGNLTISRTGGALYEYLFMNFDFINLLKELNRESKLRDKSRFKILANASIQTTKKRLEYLFPKKFDQLLTYIDMSPFTKETLEKNNIYNLYLENVKNIGRGKFNKGITNTTENVKILQMHTVARNNHINVDFFLKNKMESRDASDDKRLNEFTKQIPPTIFRKDGIERYLMRKSFEGILPDKVRLNPYRGKQAKDLSYRVLMDLDRITEILNNISNNGEITIDMNKINSTLDKIQNEEWTNNTFSMTTKHILTTVAIEQFLKQN